jgi:hypothetical protein
VGTGLWPYILGDGEGGEGFQAGKFEELQAERPSDCS